MQGVGNREWGIGTTSQRVDELAELVQLEKLERPRPNRNVYRITTISCYDITVNAIIETAKRQENRSKRATASLVRTRDPQLDVEHLKRLAEFRYQLRRFLHVSQTAAEQMGLRPQQYQMLQCVGGMPEGMAPTIANVAKRMLLKHNSAVELVDRAIEKRLLRRSGDASDHRRILLQVTPQGERLLASLAEFHTRELEQWGPELVHALDRILRASPRGASQTGKAVRLRKAGTR